MMIAPLTALACSNSLSTSTATRMHRGTLKASSQLPWPLMTMTLTHAPSTFSSNTPRAALSSARLANPPTRLGAALASRPRWAWGPHGGRPGRTEFEPSRELWPDLGAALGTGADEARSALLGIASTWLGALSRTESFFSSAGASSSSMRTLDSATFDDATLEVAPITVGAKPAAEGRLRR